MYYRYVDTPLGRMLAAGEGDVLQYLEFVSKANGRGTLQHLKNYCHLQTLERAEDRFDSLCRQLEAYFEAKLRRFDLRLNARGSDFDRSVWDQLLVIPYGETRSYGQIAARLGHATTARAVGAATGRNPIAVVVPCHRVVGAKGALTGYAGGLDRKAKLLALEAGRG